MEVDLQFRVPASFTSLTREGFVRARRDRSWALAAGQRVTAFDPIEEAEAEARVISIGAEVMHLSVDWSTQRDAGKAPEDPKTISGVIVFGSRAQIQFLGVGHKPGMAWVPSEHYEWSLKSTSPLETALEAPITAGHSFEYTSGPVGVGLPIETPQGVRTG